MFYDVPWDKRIISMRGNGIPQANIPGGLSNFSDFENF